MMGLCVHWEPVVVVSLQGFRIVYGVAKYIVRTTVQQADIDSNQS